MLGGERKGDLVASKPALREVLIDMLDDALVCATQEGKVVDCNDAACRMFGYSREELTSPRRSIGASAKARGVDRSSFDGCRHARNERKAPLRTTAHSASGLARALRVGLHGRRHRAPRRARSRVHFFQKPFSGSGLLEAVERVLR